MRIVLLGPPGSGKAELSRMISSHYGMPIITVSSVMQRAAAEHSELGRLAKEAMDMSRVSDELLLALLRIQLPQMDLRKGFVLVDLPKNSSQADVLDSLLSDLDANIELVFDLEVDRDELMERLVGRIACDSCGAQYNLYANPPLVDGVCDECGARVVRRPDDYEETISNRLRIYEAQMGPLLQHYRLTDRLQRLAADDGSDAAWEVLRNLIDAMERSKPAVSATEEPTAASAGAGQRKANKAAPSAKPDVRARDAELSGGAKKVAAKASLGAAKREEKQAAPARAASVAKKSTQKAAKKASTKKAVAKKAPAKKVAAPKAQAKKASAKKPLTKKTAAKQAASNKSLTKKTAAKKSTEKQAAPKKASAKKPVAEKTAASKASAKRPAGKKAAVKKKAASRKVTAKKTAAKRSVAKKAAVKKAISKKAAAKKNPAKKAVAQRSSAKGKKASVRKVAERPVAKKAATARPKAASKVASKRPAASKSAAKKGVSKKAKVSRKKAPQR